MMNTCPDEIVDPDVENVPGSLASGETLTRNNWIPNHHSRKEN